MTEEKSKTAGAQLMEIHEKNLDKKLMPVSTGGVMFFDVQRFEFAQRVATLFSTSTMVPEQFRNNVGNCVIALNYAERTGTDPFMCMQSMYIIHGKPAVETKFAVAMLNSSGKFSELEYEMDDAKTKCVAYATKIASGKVIRGPEVSLEMAKAEGWATKSGSKWKTLPELMLMYRSAIFFIRMYAPEVLLGMMSKDELTDISDMPWQDKPTGTESDLNAILDVDTDTGEIDAKPEPPKKKKAPAKKKAKPTVQPDPATTQSFVVLKEKMGKLTTVLACNQFLFKNKEEIGTLPDAENKDFHVFAAEHTAFCKQAEDKDKGGAE